MGDAIAPGEAPIAVARLVRSEDFERVLRTRARAHSAHFALHHLADRPSVPARRAAAALPPELSTMVAASSTLPVDDSSGAAPADPPRALWLGVVVPKRHARRSVTRSLLKRQIRCAVTRHAEGLAGGLWVVRLRAPFERGSFVSAASDALKRAAHTELERLMHSAAQALAAG